MVEDILSQTYPFWINLSDIEKQKIINNIVDTTFEKGMHLQRGDMECKGAVLLRSGSLRVYIVSEEGREVTLFRIHSGEFCVLSASCLLDSIQFDILIEASERSKVLMIPAHILNPLMESNPYVGLYMYKQAAERFSDVMWTMQQILFMGADKRVAIFLWEEIVLRKVTTLKMTHDEIARNIGSAREVVTKVLNYFSEEGVVSLGRGKLEVIDKDKLQSYL